MSSPFTLPMIEGEIQVDPPLPPAIFPPPMRIRFRLPIDFAKYPEGTRNMIEKWREAIVEGITFRVYSVSPFQGNTGVEDHLEIELVETGP
jgi:hypothetical protein